MDHGNINMEICSVMSAINQFETHCADLCDVSAYGVA